MVYDAVTECRDIQYDRIYTAVAMMLRRAYGFGAQRIIKGLKWFDQEVGSVLEEDRDWSVMMKELKKETGIVIRSGGDRNRLILEVVEDEDTE